MSHHLRKASLFPLLILSLFLSSCGLTLSESESLPGGDGTTDSLVSTSPSSVGSDQPGIGSSTDTVFDMTGDQSSIYRERLYVQANATSVAVMGGDNGPVTIEGKISTSSFYQSSFGETNIEYAMDGSSLALKLDANEFRSGRLVYFDGQSAIEIASNVDSFRLSCDGSAILYLVTPKYDHGVGGELYYYDCVTKETTPIAAGAGRLFTLSPSGDAISFTIFYEADDPDALDCYSMLIGEAPMQLDTDSFCVAITDDVNTIYYIKNVPEKQSRLLVSHNGELKELSSNIDVSYSTMTYGMFFNDSQTQILFNTLDGSFFSMNGSDPVNIAPQQATSFTGKSYYYDIQEYLFKPIHDFARTYIDTSISGARNLCNIPFTGEDSNLYYFDENLKTIEIDLSENMFETRIVGSSIICSDGVNGYIIKDYFDPDAERTIRTINPQITEDGTYYHLASPFSSSALATGSTLYLSDASGEDHLVASNVCLTSLYEKEGPDTLYFVAFPENFDFENTTDLESNLFLSLYSLDETPGSTPVLVAEKVSSVHTGDFGIAYWKYAYSSTSNAEKYGPAYTAMIRLYYSKDGTEFEEVMDREFVYQIGG